MQKRVDLARAEGFLVAIDETGDGMFGMNKNAKKVLFLVSRTVLLAGVRCGCADFG